ncbi:RNA polymerase sigma factor [Cellulomonas chitinilytica]|uniref:RNA polymerase sigma factor n=1 Tax=Cellulomonas chitinilytica TaxID=398759 RepID=A0A919NYW1_9CELL|nr:sigma-70 family RNA polymerase sigma factor [Cellulomonas chitinilytica]GIG20201.1 RNA polymerase sigma factor [Cellulomonas chitinilytica]
MDREDLTASDLVLRARAGDRHAWDALVERFMPLVLAVARRHHLAGADAEDMAQTLWMRLVEHLDDIHDPAAIAGWIATTARHECLRTLRLRRRTEPFDPLDPARDRPAEAEEALDAAVVDGVTAASRHEALLVAFAELSTRHRDLLLLLLHDPPVPYAEIGRRLGIPVGSIGPTRARALQHLREHPAVAAMLGDDAVVRSAPSP